LPEKEAVTPKKFLYTFPNQNHKKITVFKSTIKQTKILLSSHTGLVKLKIIAEALIPSTQSMIYQFN
jgi:hypothetical protein